MSRYIDAEILKERLIKNITLTNAIDRSFNEAPSIDIVFCRECKHRPIKEDADGENYGFNLIEPTEDDDRCPCLVDDGWFSWMPKDDFYCGYGERGTETHDLHTNTHECVSDIPQMETVIDKDGDVWVRRDDEWYCIGHKEFPCETCKHNQQIGSICDDCTQSDDNPSNYEPQTERSE